MHRPTMMGSDHRYVGVLIVMVLRFFEGSYRVQILSIPIENVYVTIQTTFKKRWI